MIARTATAGDAPAIAAIWNHYIRETPATFTTAAKAPEEIANLVTERLRAGHAFLVCGDADVTGFASYAPFRPGPGYARTMEHTIMLSPAACGQGLGRGLLDRIERHASAAGHRSLVAAISSGNPGALAFHQKAGFVARGVLPEAGWRWDRWWDLHLLQKRLG